MNILAMFYSGELNFQESIWKFSFDGEYLRLYPSAAEKQEITDQWIKIEMMDRQERFSNLPHVDDAYLIGFCYEESQSVVFLTKRGSILRNVSGHYLKVQVIAYIFYKSEREAIDRMSFSSPEINCIHPVIDAFDYHVDFKAFSDDGIITLTTKDYQSTTTDVQSFEVDDVTVRVCFGVTRGVTKKIGDPPLLMSSSLIFEFEPTTDYAFIFRLWKIAKRFIQFLCYRKNTFLPTAYLSSPTKNGKHLRCATLHVLGEAGETELLALRMRKYIKQSYIAGCEGKILSDIASDNLYTRHIPESYYPGRNVDEARFIMITAAFEWEFDRLYPDGINWSEEDIETQQTAKAALQNLIDTATLGTNKKLTKLYTSLMKSIEYSSFPPRFEQAAKDFDSVIGQHARNLYESNGINRMPDYKKMGFKLAKERNYLAHGNLGKEAIEGSAIPLMYTEFLVFAMQLRFYGIDDENIQTVIYDLFGS